MAEPKIEWPPPPTTPSLNDLELHVWAIHLNTSSTRVSRCAALLSAEEAQRAAKFRFERDQRRFIVAHGALRAILAPYAGLAPETLNFVQSPRGKPSLTGLAGKTAPHFNLTHSDELALVAVTAVCPVGIDVELIRPINDASGIADRFFSPRESRSLAAWPPAQKSAAFFNLWTRKEAWLKATGQGISESLDKVEVSFLPDEPVRLISLPEAAGAAREWSLFDLRPASGFVGAAAICSVAVQLRHWVWCGG